MKKIIQQVYFSFFFLIITNVSYAGFFDDLKNKAEKAIQSTASDIKRSIIKGSKNDEPIRKETSPPDETMPQPKLEIKKTKSVQAQENHNFYYPWEEISIDMKPQAVDVILQDAGFVLQQGTCSSRRVEKCFWRGRIGVRGGYTWFGRVQIQRKNGVILYIHIKMRLPKSETKQVTDRLFNSMPGGLEGKFCRNYGLLTKCALSSNYRFEIREYERQTSVGHTQAHPQAAILRNM